MAFQEQYVEIYDILYAGKPYAREVQFVLDFAKTAGCSPGTVVDYGCGTGRHAEIFAEEAGQVYGLDINEHMLAAARERLKTRTNVSLGHVSERDGLVSHPADCFVCFFDVLSYMTTNAEVDDFLSFAARATRPGGLFFFDYWYGPGVITLGPEQRWKHYKAGDSELLRLTRPTLDWQSCVVNIEHHLILTKGNLIIRRFVDPHAMRFFFKNEIEALLNHHGFEVAQFGTWDHPTAAAGPDDWSALVVCRRRGN